MQTRRYWRMPQSAEQGTSEQEWIERIRTRLDQAVHMQMVSDVPIGAFLSGGIDSSTVVGLMASHSERPIKTYSIGFTGAAAEEYYNELPYARRVAELFGTEHHEIVVRPDAAALLPRLLWHMDEPIADTAFITTYLVSQFARRDVTVILSGVGGDELFGGYRRYLGDHYLGVLRAAARVVAPRGRLRGKAPAQRSARPAARPFAPGKGLSRKAPSCRSRHATGHTSKCSRLPSAIGSCGGRGGRPRPDRSRLSPGRK